jgi:hypothetical protein
MIQLNPNCLVVLCDESQAVPTSVESLTLQILGEQASWLDAGVLKDICGAVLSYLREEQGKQSVPFYEFAEVLEEVLRGFGLSLNSRADESQLPRVVKTNVMDWLHGRQDTGFDLMLFHLLRDGLDQSLQQGEARILWVHGLRHCVKQHLGAQRWGRRCQQFNDQLIAFIRQCFDQKAGPGYSLILHP